MLAMTDGGERAFRVLHGATRPMQVPGSPPIPFTATPTLGIPMALNVERIAVGGASTPARVSAAVAPMQAAPFDLAAWLKTYWLWLLLLVLVVLALAYKSQEQSGGAGSSHRKRRSSGSDSGPAKGSEAMRARMAALRALRKTR